MSERKTSEIKLRVTPSFKAAVQLSAEHAGETMSVYMESATDDRMRLDLLGSDDPATSVPVSRNDNSEQWVSGGHEQFEVPSVPANNFAWPTNSPLVSSFQRDTEPSSPVCEKHCAPWQWCSCRSGNA